MPYAKRRTQEELNRAYGHVSSQTWINAQDKLYEQLINMGFEKQEAREEIAQHAIPNIDTPQERSFEVVLKQEVDLNDLDLAEQATVQVQGTDDGMFALKIQGTVNDDVIEKIAKRIIIFCQQDY